METKELGENMTLIMREFSNIFLEEILELPLAKAIEFTIDINPYIRAS